MQWNLQINLWRGKKKCEYPLFLACIYPHDETWRYVYIWKILCITGKDHHTAFFLSCTFIDLLVSKICRSNFDDLFLESNFIDYNS